MGYSHYDAAARGRAAWNAGKTVGTKRPLTQKQIWAIRFFLDREERVRRVGSGRPVFGGQNGIVDIRPYGKSLDGAFPESFHNLPCHFVRKRLTDVSEIPRYLRLESGLSI